MTTPRGIRVIGEKQLQKNRALIITNKDKDELLKIWNELPNGTLHVDPVTGVISQKLQGETSWVPYGVKPDNTLVISRDTQFNEESFVILEIDTKSGTFSYENAEGKKTHSVCLNGSEFVFLLEKGSYMMGRNHLEVTLDDCLIRTVMSGGIEEISDLKFKVLDELSVGQKVTVRYVKWTRVGNPYPRIYLNSNQPEEAEKGDFWLDPNCHIDESSALEDMNEDKTLTINWDRITGTPTTIKGYGIKEEYAVKGHTHRVLDFTDFPSSMPANGGDANSVQGIEPGLAPGNMPVLDGAGCISASMLPENYLNSSGAIVFQESKPSNPKNNSIWICTSASDPHIEAFASYKWIRL